jgi:hypothetical protein
MEMINLRPKAERMPPNFREGHSAFHVSVLSEITLFALTLVEMSLSLGATRVEGKYRPIIGLRQKLDTSNLSVNLSVSITYT